MKTKPRTFPSSQRGDFSHDRVKERKVLAFTQDQGFPDRVNQAFAQAQVNAQKGTVTLTIKNVPAGKVALTVLHDEDGDGKLRKNLLGIPQEGVGMTGKPLGNRAPKFQVAVIEIKGDEKKTIALKYW